MAGRTAISSKEHGFKLIFLCTAGFNLEILPRDFVKQHQFLINVNIFVAYVLNLPLNTHRPHCRSQRAGKWSLILALIYHVPTYIAVPLLGPHQSRYIESTLYIKKSKARFSQVYLAIMISSYFLVIRWCQSHWLTRSQEVAQHFEFITQVLFYRLRLKEREAAQLEEEKLAISGYAEELKESIKVSSRSKVSHCRLAGWGEESM